MQGSSVSQLDKLSVIIPLGPCEDLWRGLVTDLQLLPENAEIIFVFSGENCPRNHSQVDYSGRACEVSEGVLPPIFRSKKDTALIRQLGDRHLVLVQSCSGRAIEMNAGSEFASGQFLWFLHADSHFTKQALAALDLSIMKDPQALHYFRLTFSKDDEGSALTGINQWGARIRSEFFSVPFGDQGFCISKNNFHSIGWGRLTLKYQYLWIKQAIPELFKLYLSGERQ